jgi:hypothetical protein
MLYDIVSVVSNESRKLKVTGFELGRTGDDLAVDDARLSSTGP